MEIIPLAAESMGTRSMATFIETDDLRILFDPAVSLLNNINGHPPHALETWRLKQHVLRIELFCQKADIIILSHFHSSHVWTNDFSLYSDKTVYLKNPNQQTGPDQRRIAFGLMQQLKGVARDVCFADGRTFRMGNTELVFSPAVPHGDDRGSVVQLCVRSQNSAFLISSDVEGPFSMKACQFIIDQQPNILYLDGAPTYRPGYSKKDFTNVLNQFRKVLEEVKIEMVILDHHILRDADWETNYSSYMQIAKDNNVPLLTAAELRGEENDVFEARREHLFATDLPSN